MYYYTYLVCLFDQQYSLSSKSVSPLWLILPAEVEKHRSRKISQRRGNGVDIVFIGHKRGIS